MSKRAIAAVFCTLGVVLFLVRYALAIWYRGPSPTQWGTEDFGRHMETIGLMPWVLAGFFILAGFYLLAMEERDNPRS